MAQHKNSFALRYIYTHMAIFVAAVLSLNIVFKNEKILFYCLLFFCIGPNYYAERERAREKKRDEEIFVCMQCINNLIHLIFASSFVLNLGRR